MKDRLLQEFEITKTCAGCSLVYTLSSDAGTHGISHTRHCRYDYNKRDNFGKMVPDPAKCPGPGKYKLVLSRKQ